MPQELGSAVGEVTAFSELIVDVPHRDALESSLGFPRLGVLGVQRLLERDSRWRTV